jgi:hypothetical protein
MSTYTLVRLGLALLLIGICYILYLFYRKKKPKVIRIAFIAAVACAILIYSFPVENLFLRFESPQAAFNYSNMTRIISIIECENYAAVQYVDDGTAGVVVLTKDEKGWMPTIPKGGSTPVIVIDHNLISYQHLSPDILFIKMSIPVTSDESIQVIDSKNSNFNLYKIRNAASTSGEGIDLYYAFTKYENRYYVSINGKKIYIN